MIAYVVMCSAVSSTMKEITLLSPGRPFLLRRRWWWWCARWPGGLWPGEPGFEPRSWSWPPRWKRRRMCRMGRGGGGARLERRWVEHTICTGARLNVEGNKLES